MTRARPITPGRYIDSDKKTDAFIEEWRELGAPLSKEQAKELLHIADDYAQEKEQNKDLPRVGETADDFTLIADQADRLLKTLSNPGRSALAHLDQAPFYRSKDLRFPPRKPLIETLKKARDVALNLRKRLPPDDGGNPAPQYRNLVDAVIAHCRESADPAVLNSPSTLAKLVIAVITHGPGGKYAKSTDTTRKFIKRLL
jgi:hypothetical protein